MIKQIYNRKSFEELTCWWLLLCAVVVVEARVPQNFFVPYDVLIVPYRPSKCRFQFDVAGEFGIHSRGFAGDFNQGADTAVNALQIYQCQQNAIAALQGLDPATPQGQLAQQLIMGDNGAQALFRPFGTLRADANLMFSARFRLPYQLTFSWYLPYQVIGLQDVCWQPVEQSPLDNLNPLDFLNEVSQIGNLTIGGWKRHGFGDLLGRVEMYRTFPQNRPWLNMVGVAVRGGVFFPTGLKADPDKLLALSFSEGSGFGMHASGMIELHFRHNIIFGIDAEFGYFFGRTGMERIKTDAAQTDLLLLTKVCAFRDPGFNQRFTLYGEKVQKGGGLAGTLAYMYIKRTDDVLFPCVEGFDPVVINDAESLQESTAHSLIFMMSYDWAYKAAAWDVIPSCSAFIKVGCNGKRSVVADTVGFTVSVAF
jgi:hypothetical protein